MFKIFFLKQAPCPSRRDAIFMRFVRASWSRCEEYFYAISVLAPELDLPALLVVVFVLRSDLV